MELALDHSPLSAAFGGFSYSHVYEEVQALVRGENFLINFDGVDQKLGFYTTAFVEAQDQEIIL